MSSNSSTSTTVSKTKTVRLQLVNTTTGALRYSEVRPKTGELSSSPNDIWCVIGTLYLRKHQMVDMCSSPNVWPSNIEVTINAD